MPKQGSRFGRKCEAENALCWICGEEIDYSVVFGTTDRSFTKDHYWPISLRPDLEKIVSNFMPAHRLCNTRRSSRTPQETVWVGSMKEGRWFDEDDKTYERRLHRERMKRDAEFRAERRRIAREEAEAAKARKEFNKNRCRCGDYFCTEHSVEKKKKKPQSTRARDGGGIHLYLGPFIHDKRTVL